MRLNLAESSPPRAFLLYYKGFLLLFAKLSGKLYIKFDLLTLTRYVLGMRKLLLILFLALCKVSPASAFSLDGIKKQVFAAEKKWVMSNGMS
jgi:hypothetical protein